jgi:predicted chitinase
MSIFLSEDDLRRVFPNADPEIMASVASEWNDTLSKYHINDTKNRLLFFMAETAEETNDWRSMVEGGNPDRYRGRGLIQLTSQSNYQEIGAKLARDFPDSGLDFKLVDNPDLVAQPAYVLKTAAAWWDANGVCDLRHRQFSTGLEKSERHECEHRIAERLGPTPSRTRTDHQTARFRFWTLYQC